MWEQVSSYSLNTHHTKVYQGLVWFGILHEVHLCEVKWKLVFLLSTIDISPDFKYLQRPAFTKGIYSFDLFHQANSVEHLHKL